MTDSERATWSKRRKQQALDLLCAILYHSQTRHSQRDSVKLAGGGREELARAIGNYFNRRDEEFVRPTSLSSSFLLDVAKFTVDMGKPRHVFQGDARQVAIAVAIHLLRSRGWNVSADEFGSFVDRAAQVDPNSPGAAQEYCHLISQYWKFTGSPDEAAFSRVRQWAKRQPWFHPIELAEST